MENRMHSPLGPLAINVRIRTRKAARDALTFVPTPSSGKPAQPEQTEKPPVGPAGGVGCIRLESLNPAVGKRSSSEAWRYEARRTAGSTELRRTVEAGAGRACWRGCEGRYLQRSSESRRHRHGRRQSGEHDEKEPAFQHST